MILATAANAEGGFYMGIGTGYTSFNNTIQSGLTFDNGSTASQTTGNIASTLYFGYDFNHWLGVQGEYNVGYNTSVAGSYNVNQQLLGVSLLGHLPFSIFSSSLSGLSIFAKVGYDYDVMSFTNTGPSNCSGCISMPNSAFAYLPIYGAGIEYGFTNIGIRAEWNITSNITASNMGQSLVTLNSNMYLISILYHF